MCVCGGVCVGVCVCVCVCETRGMPSTHHQPYRGPQTHACPPSDSRLAVRRTEAIKPRAADSCYSTAPPGWRPAVYAATSSCSCWSGQLKVTSAAASWTADSTATNQSTDTLLCVYRLGVWCTTHIRGPTVWSMLSSEEGVWKSPDMKS